MFNFFRCGGRVGRGQEVEHAELVLVTPKTPSIAMGTIVVEWQRGKGRACRWHRSGRRSNETCGIGAARGTCCLFVDSDVCGVALSFPTGLCFSVCAFAFPPSEISSIISASARQRVVEQEALQATGRRPWADQIQ